MNDILTDLRNAIVDDKYPWDVTIYERAIDEIERLRADRDKWRKIAELTRQAWNTDSWIDFNDQYLKVVRGD